MLGAATLATGCATVTHGSSQEIAVTTDPEGASCELRREDKLLGTVTPTPGALKIGKAAAPIEVECTMPGHLAARQTLTPHLQQAMFDNFYVGGIVGMLVDAGSGAASAYQATVTLRLHPEAFASERDRDEYFGRWSARLRAASDSRHSEIAAKCPPGQCARLQADLDRKAAAALAEVENLRQAAPVSANGTSLAPLR